MKILWLSPIFPYPLYSGGQVRNYYLLKYLSEKNEITLFSFLRPGRDQGPVEELSKFCRKVKTFPGRKTWQWRNIALAGFSKYPFALTPYLGNQAVKKAIDQEIKNGQYDLLHLESFYTFGYLDRSLKLPIVLGNENVEYLLYRRYVEKKKFPLNRLLAYDVNKMEAFEKKAWLKADLNLAVSDLDAKVIKKATGQKVPVIENGVDLNSFVNFKITRPFENRPDVLFVGDFKYFANRDAVKLILSEIWPAIRKKLPEAKLWLVGRHHNRELKSLQDPSVLVDDRVQDIRQAYIQADVMIAPMRMGSGTNIKVLEAMAMGLPVVATSIGAEGIPAKNGKDILVADDPKEFAESVCRLIKDEKERERIGRNGQKIIVKKFDWKKIARKLEKEYRQIIKKK